MACFWYTSLHGETTRSCQTMATSSQNSTFYHTLLEGQRKYIFSITQEGTQTVPKYLKETEGVHRLKAVILASTLMKQHQYQRGDKKIFWHVINAREESCHSLPLTLQITSVKALHTTQSFVTAGGFEGSLQDEALPVQLHSLPRTYNPKLCCNAKEADTRIWLHAVHSAGTNKLVVSPDTDVYHKACLLLPNTKWT